MRFLLTVFFTLLACVTFAQQSDLNKRVQLKKGWMRIDAVMQEIYKQGGLKFSFNSQQINPSKKVRITNDHLSVGAILGQVEKTANVKFKVVGRHIVLLNQAKAPKTNTANVNKRGNRDKNVKQGSRNRQHVTLKKIKPKKYSSANQKAVNHNQLIEKVVANNTAVVNADTPFFSQRIENVNNYNERRIPALSRLFILDTIPTVSRPAIPFLLVDTVNKKERPFWISAGINASELSYANPTVRAGYKRIYGSITAEWCSCSPTYRWGIGYEQEVGRSWKLHYNLTTGTTAALYPAETLPEVLVKNRHYKWNVLANKTVAKNFNIQLGPVLNVLHTRYFSNDGEGNKQKIAAGALLPEAMNGDNVFTSTEAPYTFFNTYKKDRTSNWKGWIGVELGVYYKLAFSLKKQAIIKTKS